MAGKRKRVRSSNVNPEPCKRVKSTFEDASFTHPTLCLYYRRISTLRDHLLSEIPRASRSRRRKLAVLGKDLHASPLLRQNQLLSPGIDSAQDAGRVTAEGSESQLARLLDRTLICKVDALPAAAAQSRTKDFEIFSQQVSLTAASSIEEGASSQTDVCTVAYQVSGSLRTSPLTMAIPLTARAIPNE